MNEVIQKTIQIEENKEYVFRNQVDFCIGTGRMGLALTKEYQEQLSLVQKEIGFSHIRGHGLFCDDIGIYQETPEGESEYNFTYLDLSLIHIYKQSSLYYAGSLHDIYLYFFVLSINWVDYGI